MATNSKFQKPMQEPKKRLTSKRGQQVWEVDYGEYLGKRKRVLCESEAEADGRIKQWRADVKGSGEFWARKEEVDRVQITGTLVAIEQAGLTLPGVWAEYKRLTTENGGQSLTPMPYEDVVVEWKRRKLQAGKSERYVYHAGVDLMKFGEGRKQQPIHEIQFDTLEKYIDSRRCPDGSKWSKSTRRTNISLFSSLWEAAIAKGWAVRNITEQFEEIGKIVRDVLIYENSQIRNVFAAMLTNDTTKSIISSYTLRFFGCMRPEEVTSEFAKAEGLPPETYFGWPDIDLEHGLINIRKEIGKEDVRTIRLQPMAVEWLTWGKELGNEVPAVNERRIWTACCEMVGLVDRIRDGARKCCATHLRPVYRNDYDVVKDMGHKVRVLLKNYAAKNIPEAKSFEYWQINPGAVKEYVKSREWDKLLRTVSIDLEKSRQPGTVEKFRGDAIEAQGAQPKRTPSANAKSGC